MELAEIHCYPVKSLRGHALKTATVEPIGLKGDRRWLVVDASGAFRTIRELPKMVQIEVEETPFGIRMIHGEAGSCIIDAPHEGADECDITIWRDTVRAVATGGEADAFLTGLLGTKVRLVYLANSRGRPLDANSGAAKDYVNFADDFPVLLTSRSSLADLCKRAGTDIAMRRFRPNLVIAGAAPWEEDRWRSIRIGDVQFRVAAPCVRCVVTTYDPDTGEQIDPYEPLRTLMRFRRARNGSAIFGQNLIPDNSGTVSIGDKVEVLSAGASNVL
jgi:uncharacterized protein YcbX